MRMLVFSLFVIVTPLVITTNLRAQNPIIHDQFTADPSARVFGGTVYLYPSHDILAGGGRGRVGWFCMQDYHAFSSSNLTEWTDLGIIVSQDSVPWVNSKTYSMWAPDCIYRNGKYFFYFPALVSDTAKFGRGFSIGVATSDKPYGPFHPLPEPIKNVHGIDPNPFIDRDGKAYLYWAARNIYMAKLKDDMLELVSEPQIVQGLPEKGLKEGPFVFERNGKYYLTYPHVENTIERLEYAISDNPMGPFRVAGVLMDEAPDSCWTNQQSILEYENQWYLFYHRNDYSPKFDKNRSVSVDSLFFNDDGTIRKVIPTLRGVGITGAMKRIQMDRYSLISQRGASIDFLDTLDRFTGWKTALDTAGAWVQYNGVDFGSGEMKTVAGRVLSKAGGIVEVRIDAADGPVLAEVTIPCNAGWNIVRSPLHVYRAGVHNVIVRLKDNAAVEIDWIQFE